MNSKKYKTQAEYSYHTTYSLLRHQGGAGNLLRALIERGVILDVGVQQAVASYDARYKRFEGWRRNIRYWAFIGKDSKRVRQVVAWGHDIPFRNDIDDIPF